MNAPETAANTTSARFVARDVAKLFAAAVASGVAVSLAAAGITLFLANSAYAVTKPALTATSAYESAPSLFDQAAGEPGGLYIGGGCDREAVEVIERDWQIRIDGKKAEIRVMQSFMMPAEAPTTAFFEVTLPRGAALKSLKTHSAENTIEAKLMRAANTVRSAAAEVRAVSGKGGLAMWHDRDANTITTEQISKLAPGAAVTVEYTYSIEIDANQTERVFNLALAGSQVDTYDAAFRGKPATIPASVWVEWVGAKPQHLRGLSGDYAVETAPDGVVGLSWFSPAVTMGNTFAVAWDVRDTVTPAPTVAKR